MESLLDMYQRLAAEYLEEEGKEGEIRPVPTCK